MIVAADLAAWIETRRPDVERALEAVLPAPAGPAATAIEAMRYAVFGGGKRLRPLLVILSSRLSGYDGSDHIVLGNVVEYLHAATLLHDGRVLLVGGTVTANPDGTPVTPTDPAGTRVRGVARRGSPASSGGKPSRYGNPGEKPIARTVYRPPTWSRTTSSGVIWRRPATSAKSSPRS